MSLSDSQTTRQEKLCGEKPRGRGDVRQVPMNIHTMFPFTMVGAENMIRTVQIIESYEVLTTSSVLEFMFLKTSPLARHVCE